MTAGYASNPVVPQVIGQHSAPYNASFAVEVRGNAVKVHRKTEKVLETLSGTTERNSLQLHGIGYWLDAPSMQWQLVIDGEFPTGATTYSGKGKMRANGRTLRDCELQMTRNARRAIKPMPLNKLEYKRKRPG